MPTKAVIIDFKHKWRPGGSAPVYVFEVLGTKYKVTSKIYSGYPRYSIMQEIDILYPVNDPLSAVIDNFIEKWFDEMVCLILGIFFTFFGFIDKFLYLSQKIKKKKI